VRKEKGCVFFFKNFFLRLFVFIVFLYSILITSVQNKKTMSKPKVTVVTFRQNSFGCHVHICRRSTAGYFVFVNEKVSKNNIE